MDKKTRIVTKAFKWLLVQHWWIALPLYLILKYCTPISDRWSYVIGWAFMVAVLVIYRLWRRWRRKRLGFQIGDIITIYGSGLPQTRKVTGVSKRVLTLDEEAE